MKALLAILAVLVLLTVSGCPDEQRYQAIPIEQLGGIYVLDTQEGHLWLCWLTGPSEFSVDYCGKVGNFQTRFFKPTKKDSSKLPDYDEYKKILQEEREKLSK